MPSEKKASFKDAPPKARSPYAIKVVQVKPQLLAAAKGWAKMSDVAQQIFATLDIVWAAVKEQGLENDGQNIVIYRPEHGASFEKEGCAIEAGTRVKAPFTPKGKLVRAETPGGTAVVTRHTGAYAGLPAAHDAIFQWCGANGREPAGACWEVYGHWTEDTEKLVTDVYYQLKD